MSLNKIFTRYLFIAFLCSLSICPKAFCWGNIESKLIYYPINRKIADVRIKTDSIIEDTYFYSLDGIKLNAWYIKAQKNMPTVIYCHGQGENISTWQSVAQFLINNGYGIFMVDYRGHGRSEGKPTESGLYIDLESSIKYLKDFKGIVNNDLILWGRSLGGAVVADIASRNSFKGVILESTFTNIREAAMNLTRNGILEGKGRFWSRFSTKFIKCFPIVQTFETDQKIHRISSPLLIAHSMYDDTVPVVMSYKLAQLNRKAELFVSEKGSHHSSEWLKPKALEFLKSLN